MFDSLLHRVVVLLIFVTIAAAAQETPNCAHVVGATAKLSGGGSTWTFSATISLPYEVGWDQYADAWQVRSVSGDDVLGTRSLAHPHVTEQPFTRSLSGVVIAGDGITSVVFAARDSVEGYCGDEFTLRLPEQGGFCFSGTSTVQVKKWNDGRRSQIVLELPLNRLKLGDLIHVGHDKYERIYSFGHYSPFAIASFLQIETSADSTDDSDAKSMMQLSPSHMVFTTQSCNVAVAASRLRVGDEVLMGRNNHNGTNVATITSISSVISQGLFAPFTPSGKLVVNGILVSSYIAMMGSSTPLAMSWLLHHQHWLAHSFQLPHRLACHYYYYERGGSRRGCGTDESYTPEGLSTWVAAPHSMAKRVMKLNPLLLDILLSLLAIGMWLFNVVEMLLIKSNLYRMIR